MFLLNLVREFLQLLPPLEVAITFGGVFFALSWIVPRRIVDLPQTRARRSTLAWGGILGSLVIVVVATVASAIAAHNPSVEPTGVAGWWGRPAPLLVAAVVVTVSALALRRDPLPEAASLTVAPRRSWRAFAPQRALWVLIVAIVALALTCAWQVVIATRAPQEGPFFGTTPNWVDLPVYMTFNRGYGYLAGVGWPNYLATVLVLALAAVVLYAVLDADSNRPVSARVATMSRVERERSARIITFIMLGGLLATLGAVWMHAGSIGQITVGFDEEWVSEDVSYPRVFVGSGYDAFARPLNVTGYLLQGIGVAFLLRLATDTIRSVFVLRKQDAAASPDAERARAVEADR